MRDIPMPASDAATAGEIISRIGQLTRMLRDSMRELGLDQAIAQAAEAIPDARDRLDYVVTMTAQAAERALNCVEAAQPRQAELESGANALKGAGTSGSPTPSNWTTRVLWLTTRASIWIRYRAIRPSPMPSCWKS